VAAKRLIGEGPRDQVGEVFVMDEPKHKRPHDPDGHFGLGCSRSETWQHTLLS
jgi:hypothetical protein